MTFADIPANTSVFLDANTVIYHFANDPKFGATCTELLKRVEKRELYAVISTHVLADVAHRLMTLEAISLFGWPPASIAVRLRKHHNEIPKLKVYREAIARIALLGIQVVPVFQPVVEAATMISHWHELLTGDATIVAVMNANSLTNLASNDSDFDRVPGITRYTPV